MKIRPIVLTSIATLCVAALVLATTIAEPLAPLPIDPFWLAFLGLPIVGAFIAMKRPGNPVGLVVLGIGAAAALSAATNLAAYGGWPRPDLLVLGNQLAFIPVFYLLPLFFLIFPDGDLPSARWKVPAVAAAVAVVVLAIWFALRPVEYSFDNIEFLANPLAIEDLAPYDAPVLAVLQLLLGGFGVATLIRAILSYRQAGALRRMQMKWVIVPSILGPLTFAVGLALEDSMGTEFANVAAMAAIIGGANGVAAGIGAAVLRHNLFEIDRIISRTVTYSLVVGFLGLVIVSLVAVMTMFVPSDDPLVVAVATLAVFALFNPVRRRIQRSVDRRFNRSRYDAARIVDRFGGDLQERVDPEELVDDWVEVVESTMQPESVGVWVRP